MAIGWIEEGGLEGYLYYAKNWLTVAARFMKLSSEDSPANDSIELCLQVYFESGLEIGPIKDPMPHNILKASKIC